MASVDEGAAQLEALGRRLKAAGGSQLRKDLLAGIRKSNKGTIAKIRSAARSELPKSGGLAARVAGSSIGTRTRLSGQSVGVTIAGTGKNVRNLRAIDDGTVRHPVFGGSAWVSQSVRPGWFTKPIQDDLPHIRSEIERVMVDVARRIERGI